MKYYGFILIFFFISIPVFAQEVKKDSVPSEINAEENDTILGETLLIEEIVISKSKLNYESKKNFLILQNRVYRVYPYAKIASERLTALNKNIDKLKTKKEKKKYFKIVEGYIENEFSEKLKKLSRKQGQILIKLIYRQTGITTFDLVKDYKSGWKAFWASNTAKIFDLDMKAKYAPYNVNEDYLVETILVRAFKNGRLVPQASANPVDYDKLSDYWIEKVSAKNNSK